MLYLADMGKISGTQKSGKVRFEIVGNMVRDSGRKRLRNEDAKRRMSSQGRGIFSAAGDLEGRKK